jgi:hypothetical protein
MNPCFNLKKILETMSFKLKKKKKKLRLLTDLILVKPQINGLSSVCIITRKNSTDRRMSCFFLDPFLALPSCFLILWAV